MLIFSSNVGGSCVCRCGFIFRGFIGSCVGASCFRLGFSFSTYVDSSCSFCVDPPSDHLGVCLARSCCHLDGLVGLVYVVRAHFLSFMASTGGARRVSHCATAVQTFFPSTIDWMDARSESAMIIGQSTRIPSYVAMMKLAVFLGIT